MMIARMYDEVQYDEPNPQITLDTSYFIVQYPSIPSISFNTLQYPFIPFNTLQYPSILFNTLQYPSIFFNILQYPSISCSEKYPVFIYVEEPCVTLLHSSLSSFINAVFHNLALKLSTNLTILDRQQLVSYC